MLIFLIISGLMCISMGIFLLGGYIRLIKKGKCVIGKICGIEFVGNYGVGGTSYFIVVQFKEDGHDRELVTLNQFMLLPFFEKRKLSRLRKKHIGRRVHIYYTPDKKKQVLLREYMWKEFLACAFLFFLGAVLILAGINKWY